MKNFILSFLFILVGGLAFTSCKKDYTCTCTTTVGSISSTKTYNLNKQRLPDANSACDRFESDANNSGIGTTNCNL